VIFKPEPTKRAMIDVGRHCNAACKFCYYHHLGDLSKQTYKSRVEIEADIRDAIDRGNTYIDFSGGEPTLHPELPEIIASCGVPCCVITNATCGAITLQRLITAGVDDFLVSVHGTAAIHDKVVGILNARNLQLNFMDSLRVAGIRFRFNCVIGSHNQYDILNIAETMAKYNPSIVNFINFNPHGDWQGDIKGIRSVCANLDVVGDALNKAIPYLEHNNIGVNVRYFPMCKLAEEYRRCVCNDLHVMFDPYEWDNQVEDHSIESFTRWGVTTSNNVEWKLAPCSYCDIKHICGGINKAYNSATQGEYPEAINSPTEYGNFYHYRQHNFRTLQEKGTLCNSIS